MRPFYSAIALASALLALSACGKAGRPVQPPDSQYPRVYPNPSLGPTPAKQKEGRALPPEWDEQDLKQRFTPEGSYIDPSVNATIMNSPSRVLPGSNLPNSGQVQDGTSPMTQGLRAPGASPLPPVQPTSPEGEEEQPQ